MKKPIRCNGVFVGMAKMNYAAERMEFHTERDVDKKQIFTHKFIFSTVDGNTFRGENCIGISLNVLKKLVALNVELICFKIKNFPRVGDFCRGTISMKSFMARSVKINEGSGLQRIVAMNDIRIKA